MRISDWSSDVCSSDLDFRRVGLSATIADPAQYAAWLAPDADARAVTLVEGEPGADPDIRILLPESAVPWAGPSGRYTVHQVMAQIAKNRTTIISCNTRRLAELILQGLVKVNDLYLPDELGAAEVRGRIGKD